MKVRTLRKITNSLVLLGCLSLYSSSCLAYDGSLTLRGFSGPRTYGEGDWLFGLNQRPNSLLFLDAQGQIADRSDGFGALGLGYRTIKNNVIYGGNLFADYAQSCRKGYGLISPGIEAMWSCFDLRLNGYVPVTQNRHTLSRYFPSGLVDGVYQGDSSFIVFQGHQQFEHRFLAFEEVGPGLDAAIGFYLPQRACSLGANLHAGGYYYSMKDQQEVRGVATRLELPFNANWAISSEASYDNYYHGAVTVGLRFQLGHIANVGCSSLCDRLYQPVTRHIGPIGIGTGVPVVRGHKDEGLFLTRDNIFFFSETGTAVVGSQGRGTFEDPFANTQFNQATVGTLGPNTNFYFSPGSYNLAGTVNLFQGQSLYGRDNSFRASALGDARPILAGEIGILGNTNHVLDSIQLIDINTTARIVLSALTLTNGEAVVSNSVIRAQTATVGNDINGNVALGIVANGSNLLLDHTLVEAIASVSDVNFSFGPGNVACALGNIDGPFSNNNIIINSSLLNAIAEVGTNGGDNFSSGIGINLEDTSGDFSNNQISLINTSITAQSLVVGNNIVSSFLFASGIGNNVVAQVTNFNNNSFRLIHSNVLARAEVGGNNTPVALTIASGIGNNNIGTTANFSDNDFQIVSSSIIGQSEVGGNNTLGSSVLGSGIGNNNLSNLGTANFNGNDFQIVNSSISGEAHVVGGDSGNPTTGSFIFGSGIGNNNEGIGNFSDNNFQIASSSILGKVLLGGDNSNSFLFASGIGNNNNNFFGATTNFSGNDFQVNNSSVQGRVQLNGNNTSGSFLFVSGIGNNRITGASFDNNQIQINCSNILATALIFGRNDTTSQSFGINASDLDNLITLDNSVVTVLAHVNQNTGINEAVGLSALGSGSIISTFNSLVNVAAFVDSNSNINNAIGEEGNVKDEATTYNVVVRP